MQRSLTKKLIGGGLIAAVLCLGLAPEVRSQSQTELPSLGVDQGGTRSIQHRVPLGSRHAPRPGADQGGTRSIQPLGPGFPVPDYTPSPPAAVPPTNPLPGPPGYPPGDPPPPVILSGLAGYWSSNTGQYHSMADVAGFVRWQAPGYPYPAYIRFVGQDLLVATWRDLYGNYGRNYGRVTGRNWQGLPMLIAWDNGLELRRY